MLGDSILPVELLIGRNQTTAAQIKVHQLVNSSIQFAMLPKDE